MDNKDLTTLVLAITTLISVFLNYRFGISAKREEIRYQRFFDRQARVIATTYKKLVRFHTSVERYVKAGENTIYPEVQATGEDFKKYYYENAIYISDDMDKSVNIVIIILSTISTFYSEGQTRGTHPEELRKEIEPYLPRLKNLRNRLRSDFYNNLLGRHGSEHWKPFRSLWKRKGRQQASGLFPPTPDK